MRKKDLIHANNNEAAGGRILSLPFPAVNAASQGVDESSARLVL